VRRRASCGRRAGRAGAALAGLAACALAAPPAQATPDRFDTVVIDAGHGGDDHGAEGPRGLLEKDLTLDVARRLARRLEREGVRVVLARREDRFVGLEERTRVANDARADLFLSIHANGAEARAARGVETFFASLEASDEASKRLAIAENEAFGGAAAPALAGGDPLAAILGDMIATEHLVESQEFARLALHQLAAGEGTHSRGVKQAPFVVLMGVQMPAALVEIGFITNSREEALLAQAAERERIAAGLALAIAEFGRRFDARRGGAPAGGPPEPRAPGAAAGGGGES
jgi:N-acetylmuramoyl-L-alanine amidase